MARPVVKKAEDPKARSRREWLIVGGTIGLVLLILVILTYNEARASRLGFLAGIGWRPLQSAVLTMLVFAVFTMGLSLEFGYTGLINFGHVAFMAIGAYTAAILVWGGSTFFGFSLGVGTSALRAGPLLALWYVLLIVVIASVIAMLFALLLGIPTLRLREDYLAIVTIGAAEVLRIFLLNAENLTRGPIPINAAIPGLAGIRDPDSLWGAFIGLFRGPPLNLDIDPEYAFLIVVALAVLAGVYVLFEWLARSPWGRVVKAIREDEDVAASLGKNVFVYKMQSLLLGSVVGALAGILYAWFFRSVTPDSFLPIVTFYAWIILVLGGVGNNKGPLVGAVLLWGIFEIARNLPDLSAYGIANPAGPQQVVIIGLLLILVMMFRPQGIVGRKEEMLFGK